MRRGEPVAVAGNCGGATGCGMPMRRQAVTVGVQAGERHGRFLRRCREWRWQRGVAGKLHRGRPGPGGLTDWEMEVGR